jgi:hypothetical protein
MENKEQNALLQIAQMSDCGSYENTMLRMKQIATEALRQSPQPINSGWVSLQDRLPENNQMVLMVHLTVLEYRIIKFSTQQSYWMTHWMPLPSKP